MSDLAQQQYKIYLDELVSINSQLSKLNQSTDDPREVHKSRRALIKKKSQVEIQVRAAKANIRSGNISQNEQMRSLTTDLIAARDLLKDSLLLLASMRKDGFDNVKAVEYANNVTSFIFATKKGGE
jgi:hypothetical protein